MYCLNLVPFLVLILLNSFLCILNGRRFGLNLPLTMMLAVYVLFFSQLLGGSFRYGFYLLTAASAAGLAAVLLPGNRAKRRDILDSNGLWVFLSIFLLFFLIDFGRRFSFWDEFMHWGKMVKEMLRLDSFYCAEQSTLIRHKDYPPFIPLFELFWCRVAGGYSEPAVTLAIHVFGLSVALPLLLEKTRLGDRRLAKLAKGGLYVLGYTVLILFLDGFESFLTVYADVLIGLFFSYSMYLVFTGEAFRGAWGYITYVLSLVSILYTKQIGIAFCLISLFYFGMNRIRQNGGHAFRKILSCAVPAVLLAAAYFLWDRLTASESIYRQFDVGRIDLRLLLGYLKEPGLQHDTVKRCIEAIFKKNMITGVLPVTFASSVLIVIAVLEALHLANRENFRAADKNLLAVTLTGGAAGYFLALIALYVFCFEQREMETLHSFSRYTGSYFIGEAVLLLAVWFSVDRKKRADGWSVKKLGLIVLAAMILLTPSNLYRLLPQPIRGGDRGAPYREQAEWLGERTEGNRRLHIVDALDQQDADYVFFGYYTDGLFVDVSFMDVLNLDPSEDGESCRRFMERVGTCDYLLVRKTSDSFQACFSRCNGGRDFVEGGLYGILQGEEGPQFALIGSDG